MPKLQTSDRILHGVPGLLLGLGDFENGVRCLRTSSIGVRSGRPHKIGGISSYLNVLLFGSSPTLLNTSESLNHSISDWLSPLIGLKHKQGTHPSDRSNGSHFSPFVVCAWHRRRSCVIDVTVIWLIDWLVDWLTYLLTETEAYFIMPHSSVRACSNAWNGFHDFIDSFMTKIILYFSFVDEFQCRNLKNK